MFPRPQRTALGLGVLLSLCALPPSLTRYSVGPDLLVGLSALPEMPVADHPLEVLVFGDSLYERFAHSTSPEPSHIRECIILGHRFLGEVSFPAVWGDSLLRHDWATNNFDVGLRMRGFPNLNVDAVGLDGQIVGFYLDMGGPIAPMEAMVDTFLAAYGEPHRVRDTTFNFQGVRFRGPKRSWRTRTTAFWLTVGANEEREAYRVEGGYFERRGLAVLRRLDRTVEARVRRGHPILDTTEWVGGVRLHDSLGRAVGRRGVEPQVYILKWRSVYLPAYGGPEAFGRSFLTLGDIRLMVGLGGAMIYDERERPLYLEFGVRRAGQFRAWLRAALGSPALEHACQRRNGTMERVSMWFGDSVWIQTRFVANAPPLSHPAQLVYVFPRFD